MTTVTRQPKAATDVVRAVISEHAPANRVREFDEAERFDHELFHALAHAGLLSGALDDSGKLSHAHQAAVLTELAAGPTSMAVAFVVQYMAVQLLSAHGTPAQKDAHLAPLLAGDVHASFALSEPDGGTDVARAMKTTATRLPDGSYSISGRKRWIGGAMDCGYMLLLARTTEIGTSAIGGITTFIVPRSTPGIETREIDTMGIRSLAQTDIFLDDVRVPAANVLGEPDRGFRQVIGTLNGERLNAAAVALGIARGAFDVALDWAKSREAFGRPIGAFQALQHSLVDARLKIESAVLLLERAVRAAEAGDPSGDVDSALAKLAASEAATFTTDAGMRLMGGWGYARELPMQRYFRDARLYTFAPLTDEMIRNYLGEKMLGLPRSY
ncbi:acyl-CoA dehydrogenase family protein [Sinomonas sp. ASV486]|uniref:Acyl-CoA dehydrogenase family protein n=1 Tax=Sinomonas puerhi TaxID=3238584 RepID=A0AB39L5X7_9MICC|nr:acyl-CoA dehydrogenase family protein [Sinomonas sp. ASV486]MDQ4490109.1 acyl-CoA dehydrogenase family protein [Sinomonas sp. ASV486]